MTATIEATMGIDVWPYFVSLDAEVTHDPGDHDTPPHTTFSIVAIGPDGEDVELDSTDYARARLLIWQLAELEMGVQL